MAFGAPGVESFERAIVTSRNHHMLAILTQMMVFRQEVVSNDDLKDRGGIDTTTQKHFLRHLINCDRIRRRLTYNPSSLPIGQIISEAIDVGKEIATPENPLGGDEIQGQSGSDFNLPFHFDGTDPNFPPRSKINLSAPVGNMLLSSLDNTIVQITRMESRFRTRFITAMDSMRIYQGYQQMHEALVALAGDENRVDIANPLPSDEPLGPDSSPNRISGV